VIQDSSNFLRPLLNVLRVRLWIIVLVVAVVVASAIGYSTIQEVKYQAESQVLVSRTNLGNVLTGTQDPSSTEFDFNRIVQTQANLARIPRVARRTIENVGLVGKRTEDQFLAQSAVTTSPNTDILTLTVTDGNRQLAQNLASAYAREFVRYKENQTVNRLTGLKNDLEDELKTLDAKSDQATQDQAQLKRVNNLIALGDSSIAVVQTARRAEQIQPKPVRNAILGLILGIALGVGMAFLVDALDTRLRRASDIEDRLGIPLLGRLTAPPKELQRQDDLATLVDPSGPDAEAFRVLRTNLSFADIDSQAKSIIITSAVQSEGKSTTIANLAVAMARAGQRVILADFDFRRPYVERFFGLQRVPGATGIVLGRATADEALIEVDVRTAVLDGVAGFPGMRPGANGSTATPLDAAGATGTLHVLPTGELPPNVGEFVTSDAVRALLKTLDQRCDVLLIDAPPLLQVGDTMALSPHVEAVLLVARLGVVRKQMVDEVKRLLESCPASAVGVVITDASIEPGRGYGYGYGYYYTYGEGRGGKREKTPSGAPPTPTS
jgi:polysaccharide biosynthesis transport protein